MKKNFRIPVLGIAILFFLQCSAILSFQSTSVGPKRGLLVIAGGSRLGPEIIDRFIELAGGKDAPIVVIPTAGGRDKYDDNNTRLDLFTIRGATNVTYLHTYDPEIADTEDFVKPLKTAGGVWFSGGRQWRLTDAYLNTRTHEELFNLLKQGGVIGGTSAGASVQASFMVRGAPEGNTIMMAKGHEEGLGFIRNVAIDQHIDKRNRFNDLIEVIKTHPELLGIGLYESTAIIVQGDLFEVVGNGKVAIYDIKRQIQPGEKLYYLLNPGDIFNLKHRKFEKTGVTTN